MQTIYSDVTISMSEFKKNPAAVLRDAKSKPVAVLNHNKAAFYMVEPALFEALLEELSDQDLHRTVLSRMNERAQGIEVDIDAIWKAFQAQVQIAICAQCVGRMASVGWLS